MKTTPDTRRWWVVVLLFIAVVINYIDRGNLSITAVPLMNEMNISPAGMGASGPSRSFATTRPVSPE